MIIIMIIITTTIANVKRRKVYVYQKANGKAPSKGRTNIEHHSIRTQYNRLKSIHLEMIKKDIKSAPKRNDGKGHYLRKTKTSLPFPVLGVNNILLIFLPSNIRKSE